MEQSGGLGHHSMHGLHMECLMFVYAQSIAWICIISWSYLNPNAPCILCMMRCKCTLLNGYYTKLPVITDKNCTSIARIWVMGFTCIWHHDNGADTRCILTMDNHICHASSSTNRHHNRGLAWLDYEQHQISGAVSAGMYGVHMFSFVFMFQEDTARIFGISLACMHSYTAWWYTHNAVNIMLVHGPSTRRVWLNSSFVASMLIRSSGCVWNEHAAWIRAVSW